MGLAGLEVAILAGLLLLVNLLAAADLCPGSPGFLYVCMSSLLDTLCTFESGLLRASGSDLFVLRQGRNLEEELFFSSFTGSGLTGGGGAGLLVDTGLLWRGELGPAGED